MEDETSRTLSNSDVREVNLALTADSRDVPLRRSFSSSVQRVGSRRSICLGRNLMYSVQGFETPTEEE